MAWQVMTREPAQAGNRASRTEHYLQWWENSPEWEAEVSAVEKRHNSSLFPLCFLKRRGFRFLLANMHIDNLHYTAPYFRWRPYRVECTGSLPTSEVKRRRARLVLGWGTAREDLRVLPAF